MPPGSPHAAEPANNPELRQIRENRADGSGFAGFVIPSRTESMRSRSRRSATRCSSDRRFSRNNILASSAAPRPDRPMASGNAGVGASGRLAECDERRRTVGCARVLEAECCRGIEEAVSQDADVQCACEACEKRAQPCAVCDHCR
jgi:hypothetical protein